MTGKLTYEAAVANHDELRRRADAHRIARDHAPDRRPARLVRLRGLRVPRVRTPRIELA